MRPTKIIGVQELEKIDVYTQTKCDAEKLLAYYKSLFLVVSLCLFMLDFLFHFSCLILRRTK